MLRLDFLSTDSLSDTLKVLQVLDRIEGMNIFCLDITQSQGIQPFARQLCIITSIGKEFRRRRPLFPYQISNLSIQCLNSTYKCNSHYIYRDKQAGGKLYCSLRWQKAWRKGYGTSSRRGPMANQVSIDDRPAVVATRQRIGDWDGDTVIGNGHRGDLEV